MDCILIIQKNKLEVTKFIASAYNLIEVADVYAAWKLLCEKFDEINLIIMEGTVATENNYSFLRDLQDNPKYATKPVLAATSQMPSPRELKCLEYGVIDFLTEPFCKEIVENRIRKAIRNKDSVTFHDIEQMFKELPSNIYLKDTEGRYVFCSHYWHHLEHNSDPNWTIRGKTDLDIRKDRENAIVAHEKDKQLLKTGVGTSYVIEINVDDVQEFYEIIKRPVRNAKGDITGIVGLINDVTEHELLKKQLKKTRDFDALTGLYNHGEVQKRMELKLHEARDNHSKVSFIMLDIDNFKQINESFGSSYGDCVLADMADILSRKNKVHGGHYYVGRWGGEEFMIVLPETSAVAAMHIAEEIRLEFQSKTMLGLPSQSVSLGVTESRPDDTLEQIRNRVSEALHKAKENGKNQVETL
ncbi:MAG: diguanylate cyclase [Fibrobacter sp.]|nr:diguanylate cyclase [Fibrobacter sp.]